MQQESSRLGLLDIECRLSEPQPTAGAVFTLVAYVANPYDCPIDILAVRVMMPSKFLFVSKDRGIDRGSDDDHSRPSERLDATEDAADGAIRLQPGDTLVHSFNIRTKQWFFASTEQHELQVVVSYAVGMTSRRQAAKIALATRTRTIAPVIGALFGSLAGVLAKLALSWQASRPGIADLALQSLAGAVLAVVATVMAGRRLGAQPVVVVEDIYGGFILGFLVGYLGRDFFDSMVVHQTHVGAGL